MKKLFDVIAVSVVGCFIFSSYVSAVSERSAEELLFQDIPYVFVASQQYEPLSEAPVISNVITAEEIKKMGARTLDDILLTLPGFSHIQDHNEYFSAERGIYASAQQKILVLRDGHRLNSRSYSEANFDYSISLENIKRIEVQRGPGGSLYGDVALTAVINIITKDGRDLQGIESTAGFGNFGQKKASLVAGKEFGPDKDILFSGSFYENDGQKVSWHDPRYPDKEGTSIIYGFRDTPSYDTYLKYRNKDIKVLGSRRYGHYIEPRSGAGITGQIYDINNFVNFAGETPGLSSAFDHFEISYNPKINDYEFTSKAYFDGFQLRANLVIDSGTFKQGNLTWAERTVGMQSQISKPYSLSNLGNGNILVGLQVEEMEVYDSNFSAGVYPNIKASSVKVLKTGKERTYALFTQVKHKIIEELITNLGFRYDYKERREDVGVQNVDQLSPRAAVIYSPLDIMSFRLSYAHSFVDAPYWYRYNTMPSYQGASNLKPEVMDSYQFSIKNKFFEDLLTQRVNLFYNVLTNVVFRNLAGIYTNAFVIKVNGIEYELEIKRETISLRTNYTYQAAIEATGYASQDWMLENVPQHMANIIVDYAPFYGCEKVSWRKYLWLNANIRYVGSQFARWGKALANRKDTVDSAIITNVGWTLDRFIAKDLSLRFHIYNLFDQQYYQGGSVEYPFLQPGKWYMGELTYKF